MTLQSYRPVKYRQGSLKRHMKSQAKRTVQRQKCVQIATKLENNSNDLYTSGKKGLKIKLQNLQDE